MGAERAVPATKTVTGQLTAFAIIAAALGDVPFTPSSWSRCPIGCRRCSTIRPHRRRGEDLAGASQLIVVARGYLFAAALETALKIKETCSLLADGYSAADLRHGPIAAVTRGLPVIALCTDGQAEPTSHRSSKRCAPARRTCSSSATANTPGSRCRPACPSRSRRSSRWSGASSSRTSSRIALGYDPDSPPGLTKVTAT